MTLIPMPAVRNSAVLTSMAVLLLAAAPAGAVVDIAPQEVGSDPGWSGNINVSYSKKTGNTDTDEGDVGGKIQYDNNRKSLAFIQGTYEQSKSSDVKTEDEMLTHARYLHKLYAETWYAEAFLQRYENTFRGIEGRWLAGGNVRWRFFSHPTLGKLYVGAGAFQEEIDYTDDYPGEDQSNTRLNSYLAYTLKLGESTDFSMVGYYQPNWEDSEDCYTAINAELKVHVVSGMYLSLSYEVDRDSHPPEGIEKVDEEISTSLIWEF